MGLLQRIFNWKRDYEEAYEVEEWNEIVYDRDDLQVHNRKQREEYVRGCLEQIAEASREVENLQHEYQVVTSHLKDIEEIEALPENESRLLMECAKRIDTLEGQQSGYKERKNRMTDEKFYQMECMEEEVQEAYEKLEKAEEFIFLEYFIINSGHMWDSVLDVLRRKVAQGVDVRVIYDDVGCADYLPANYCQTLRSYGIKAMVFNKFVPVVSVVMNNRDHRKITVIDGKVGFIGGINISDEYINKKERFGHWKDTGLMFKGPGVENLTIMFLEMWNAFEEKEGGYRDFVPAEYEEKGGEGDGYILSFSDSPLDDENASENVYADILYNANDYVYITTPYLAIDSSLQNALCLAAKRGVDVRLITPGIPDKKMVYRLTRSYYASLIRAGVKIYEYTPGFVHAKSYVADDKIGVVGTINMDYRSLYLHFECGTLMYDSPAVIDLRNDDLATIEKCRKIELSDCRTSFFGELIDRVLRVIAPLL